jgi:hypothetical protein
MDEKIYGYLVTHSVQIDKCSEGVDACMKALVKQSKVNRIQRLVNISLLFLVVTCVKNITNLNTLVKTQGEKIEALEESSEVEDKKRKGE